MAQLFEVAVLETPTPNERENGGVERLVFGPKAVVAQDKESAIAAAVIGIETGSADKARLQVLVRPFSR